MLKIYLQLLKKSRRSAGWTLAELIIAAALTLVVVGAAGFGLVTILRENKMANATGEMQYDSNRAGEFVSEEIRNASRIENIVNLSTGAIDVNTLSTMAPTFNYKTGDSRQPILALKIPGVAERVIYYVETSASPWRGPLVIRRWGPSLSTTGTYSKKVEPEDWKGNVLIDMVAQTVDSDKKRCKNPTWKDTDPATLAWYRIPQNDAEVKGFFICVREDGQLVEVHTQATTSNQTPIDRLASNKIESRYRSKFNYDVVTQVFARSRAEGAVGLKFPDYGVLSSGIFPTEGGNMKVTLLSSNLPCLGGGGSKKEPVTVFASQVDPVSSGSRVTQVGNSVSVAMAANKVATLTVADSDKYTTPTGAGCDPRNLEIKSSFTSKDKAEMVYGTNGDVLSSLIKDATALATVKTVLQSKGLLDSTETKLKLADNQLVYFAEVSKIAQTFDLTTFRLVDKPETDPVLDDAIMLVELLP